MDRQAAPDYVRQGTEPGRRGIGGPVDFRGILDGQEPRHGPQAQEGGIAMTLAQGPEAPWPRSQRHVRGARRGTSAPAGLGAETKFTEIVRHAELRFRQRLNLFWRPAWGIFQ